MFNKKGNNWIDKQLTIHFEMNKAKDINCLKQE